MSRQIVIRTGTAADAQAVAALHSESRRTAYAGIMPPELLGDVLAAEWPGLWEIRLTADYGEPAATPTLLIAEADGEALGFAYLVPQPDGRTLLDNLHVRPDRTGTGIGTRLLHAALAHAPLYLEVLCANTRAVSFYEREGGTRTARREAHLPGGRTLPEYEYSWATTPGRTPSPTPPAPPAGR